MSQFLLYIFTVFVKNLVLSVQVRGSPYSKVISPKDPNTTSERACSLEFRNSGNIGPCLFYELRTNYQGKVINFRCTWAQTLRVMFDKG